MAQKAVHERVTGEVLGVRHASPHQLLEVQRFAALLQVGFDLLPGPGRAGALNDKGQGDQRYQDHDGQSQPFQKSAPNRPEPRSACGHGPAIPKERCQPTGQGQGETQTEADEERIFLGHQDHDRAQNQPGQQADEHAPPESETAVLGGQEF